MAQRQLLTDEERQALLGIPVDADDMARCFTLSRADRHLVAARRRDANRIGFAVQLTVLRHPCSCALGAARRASGSVAGQAA